MLAHHDVYGLEMWTSEDPAPELGHSSCILTFRKHAYNVTFGIRQCRKMTGWISKMLLMQQICGVDFEASKL